MRFNHCHTPIKYQRRTSDLNLLILKRSLLKNPTKKFPLLNIAIESGKKGGTYPVVFNAESVV